MRLRVIAGCGLPLVAAAACANAGGEPGEESPSLATAAEEVVGFLRGAVPFDRLHIVDTVTLRLGPGRLGRAPGAPESGAARAVELDIRTGSGQAYSVVRSPGRRSSR